MDGDLSRTAGGAILPQRIASLDEYRGYAIFGMILVNYLGEFALPGLGYMRGGEYVDLSWLVRHSPAWFSYADTIAPIFIFVVGMGFRLSLQRRFARDGRKRGILSALRRYSILAFIGLCWGGFDWQVSIWDALLDIALAGMLSLPFIDRAAWVRVAAAVAYLVFYQVCYTWLGYGEWTMNNSIDGGPLGIFSWAFILLMGTLAMDLLEEGKTRKLITHCLLWGVGLAVLGWIFKWPWGSFKEHWPFSQRGMSAPYALYSTGIAFLTFIPFYLVADVWGKRFPHLKVLGSNPLVMYIAQGAVCAIFTERLGHDVTLFVSLSTFVGAYAICYGIAAELYRRKIFIKV